MTTSGRTTQTTCCLSRLLEYRLIWMGNALRQRDLLQLRVTACSQTYLSGLTASDIQTKFLLLLLLRAFVLLLCTSFPCVALALLCQRSTVPIQYDATVEVKNHSGTRIRTIDVITHNPQTYRGNDEITVSTKPLHYYYLLYTHAS